MDQAIDHLVLRVHQTRHRVQIPTQEDDKNIYSGDNSYSRYKYNLLNFNFSDYEKVIFKDYNSNATYLIKQQLIFTIIGRWT